MPRRPPVESPSLSRYNLYELAVTNPLPLARFLAGVHGGGKVFVLREDFCGSAALARAFAAEFGRAIAVDKDGDAVSHIPPTPGLLAVTSDVLACGKKADMIAATNFPLGYFHSRSSLVKYLRHARGCLKPRGIFAADMYGGSDTFTPGKQTRVLRGPNGERITYIWQQVSCQPLRARVRNAIHFSLRNKGTGRAVLYRNAFTYDWRIWSIPELRDAYQEAGFRRTEVYDRVGDAVDGDGRVYAMPLADNALLDDPYVVYVVGRR